MILEINKAFDIILLSPIWCENQIGDFFDSSRDESYELKEKYCLN